jgi:hypothetical protein
VLRSQVFSTSQRLVPPTPVPALFHAGNTPGVFPFRGFPSPKSVRLSTSAPLLTLPLRFRSGLPWQAMGHRTFPARPPSGGQSSSESVHPAPGVNPNTGAVPLLGFFPSKGLPDYAISTLSRTLLSHTLAPVRLTRRFGSPLPGAPESHSRNLWLVSEETAVLPGVCSLVTLHTLLESALPWLIVSPRVPECVAAS